MGEGVADFVTYCYVDFEGQGGTLRHSYVTADTQIEISKSPISFCCAVRFLSTYTIAQKTLIVAYFRRGKKIMWVWSPRAQLLPRARHIFFILLFHFLLSLTARIATVYGKKICYLVVITFFALHGKSGDYFQFSLHLVRSCNEILKFSLKFFTYPVFQC